MLQLYLDNGGTYKVRDNLLWNSSNKYTKVLSKSQLKQKRIKGVPTHLTQRQIPRTRWGSMS